MTRVRRAVAGDAAEICAVHLESIRTLCAPVYSDDQIVAWTGSLTPERYLSAMDRLSVFVAEEDRRILGFFILDLAGAELGALYLHPDAVGRGIGRQLLEHAESLARGSDLPELKLEATLNAVAFYEASGYHRVGVSTHVTPTGIGLPCVEMTKAM